MRKLFNFLFKNRAILLFAVLELICGIMVVNSRQYQQAQYFNSSAEVAAKILTASQNTENYFRLRDANLQLANENARLRALIEKLGKNIPANTDSTAPYPFEFISAKVVNNTTALFRNFITIDKGSRDGVKPGMAVTGPNGIVGKVKAVSDSYAVVISLLNVDEHVSAAISRTGNFGTIRWDGVSPDRIKLLYLPRHSSIWSGDTVVTSGFNAIFPPDLPVGIVREVQLKDNDLFYDVSVELSQDFSRLQFVDVIFSRDASQIDSLRKIVEKP